MGRYPRIEGLCRPGAHAVLAYRFAHWVNNRSRLVSLLLKPIAWAPQYICLYIYGISLQTTADIGPTGLALQLFVRGQGSLESPVKYFNAKRVEDESTP